MLKMIGPFGIVIVVGCLASTVFAQGGNAVINGTVFDQAKSVLPGVTVTVTNEATGISREAVSGPEGHFVVPTLLPGTYTIRTTLTGFQGQTREGIVVRIGQELTIDLTMSVAGVAEQIVVTCPGAHHRDDGQPHRRRRLRPGDRPAPQPGTQSSLVDAARAGPGAGR